MIFFVFIIIVKLCVHLDNFSNTSRKSEKSYCFYFLFFYVHHYKCFPIITMICYTDEICDNQVEFPEIAYLISDTMKYWYTLFTAFYVIIFIAFALKIVLNFRKLSPRHLLTVVSIRIDAKRDDFAHRPTVSIASSEINNYSIIHSQVALNANLFYYLAKPTIYFRNL